MFVSYVYSQAGVPLARGGKGSASTADWRDAKVFASGGSTSFTYTATASLKPGDVLYRTRHGGGHVGIVEWANGSHVRVIEGNIGNDIVAGVTYARSSGGWLKVIRAPGADFSGHSTLSASTPSAGPTSTTTAAAPPVSTVPATRRASSVGSLVNGGFESGTTGWNKRAGHGDTTAFAAFYNGWNVPQFPGVTAKEGDWYGSASVSYGDDFVYQDVDANLYRGSVVTLGGAFLPDPGKPQTAYLRLADAATGRELAVGAIDLRAAPTEWTSVAVEYSVPADFSGRLRVQVHPGPNLGSLLMDGITLTVRS
jgi:hypothetical protein